MRGKVPADRCNAGVLRRLSTGDSNRAPVGKTSHFEKPERGVGGFGSGRYGVGRKRATCEALRVDLFYLGRHGMLTPGRVSRYHWTSAGQPCGSISVVAFDDRIVLLFRASVDGQGWESCSQSVALVSVPTNFGLRRLFQCPTCHRLCRDLYGGRMRFACRKCLNLAFLSQYQSDWERAADQARALRKKVGMPVDATLNEPLLRVPRMRPEARCAGSSVGSAVGERHCPVARTTWATRTT